MDSDALFLTTVVVAIEIALISLALGAIAWWSYRKAVTEAQALRTEKNQLAERRHAHLRFVQEQLDVLERRRRRQKGGESRLDHLERRILEEDRKHTEAARKRDTAIWDLRTQSTKALIDAVQAMYPRALDDTGHANGGQEPTQALRRTLKQREELLEKQRRELQQLRPFRDAWLRLHRYARRESAENAAMRRALRDIPAEPDTVMAIRNTLDGASTERAALDDYLAATAASFDEASPEQARQARRRTQRISRLRTVVDTSSARAHAASERFPAVLKEQTQAISDLEGKLERAQHAQQVIRQGYSREIQQLKKNHHDAESTARSLERENRRLRERVRNLIHLSQDDSVAFVPPQSGAAADKQHQADTARKDAEIDRLHKALRQERGKAERLEQQVERLEALEAAIQSTLQGDKDRTPD
ncbi:MAG: hypothetical protein R6V11_09965 [Ectothiorhodospiraceae bacterium]